MMNLATTYPPPFEYSEDQTLCAVAAIFRFSENFYRYCKEKKLAVGMERISEMADEKGEEARGMLFRLLSECVNEPIPDDSIEVLFCQRATNSKDKHSGQTCFPGGKVDPKENEEAACRREVLEETGLDLCHRPSYVCIGKIVDRMFAYEKNHKPVLISLWAYIQITPDIDKTLKITLNESELAAYTWVSISKFWSYPVQSFRYKDIPPIFTKVVVSGFRSIPKTWLDEIGEEMTMRVWLFKLSDQFAPLWGLTQQLWTVCIHEFLFGKGRPDLGFEQATIAKFYVGKAMSGTVQSSKPQYDEVINHFLQERVISIRPEKYLQKL